MISSYLSKLSYRSLLEALFFVLLVCIFFPFATDILLAIVFAFGLEPGFVKVSQKFKIKKKWAMLYIMLIFTLFFGILFNTALFRIYDLALGEEKETTFNLANSFFRLMLDRFNSLLVYADPYLSSVGIKLSSSFDKSSTQFIQTVASHTLTFVAALVGNIPRFVLDSFVFLCFLIFFLLRSRKLEKMMVALKPTSSRQIDELTAILQDSGYSMVSSNFIVGTVQATITTLSALLVGISEISILFSVTFITSFIPVIGAGPISFLISIYFFLTEEIGKGIFMLVMAIFTGSIDNLLRPLLVSKNESNLNPVLCLIGLLGAVSVFGIPGIFFGPFIISVAVTLFRRYLEEHPAS